MFSRFLVPALLGLMFLGGCAQKAPVNGLKQTNLRFASPADDLGRPINLKAPAKRVIVIGPGAVETMFDLGAQNQLVGRDDYANFPPEAKKIAIGGSYVGPNVEQCLALRPDLVIVASETRNAARLDEWQNKIGAPVAGLTGTTFAALANDFRKLGTWIGKRSEGEALAKKFEAPVPNYAVLYKALIQTGDSPGWIAGRGTLVSDTARRAGFKNIADELKVDGYKQINFESLLVHPPDVIIVPSSKPKAQVVALLRTNPALAKLPCVQKGQVLVVDGNLLLRPGPRLLVGVQKLQQQSVK